MPEQTQGKRDGYQKRQNVSAPINRECRQKNTFFEKGNLSRHELKHRDLRKKVCEIQSNPIK